MTRSHDQSVDSGVVDVDQDICDFRRSERLPDEQDECVTRPLVYETETERVLTFGRVAEVNRRRCERWHPGFPEDEWSGADWSNAMCGEAGEAANVVKKLRRYETGHPGAKDPPYDDLKQMLADELADTFLYLDLLAAHYGLNLPDAIVRKFNAVSEREGFPEKLP